MTMKTTKTMTRKQFLDLGLGALGAMGLAACGGDDGSTGGNDTGSTGADDGPNTSTDDSTSGVTIDPSDSSSGGGASTSGDSSSGGADTTIGDSTGGDTTGGTAGDSSTGQGSCDVDPTVDIANNHMHEMTVTLEEVQAAEEIVYDIMGGAMHNHQVTLTQEHFEMLAQGLEVMVVSTQGGMHTHMITVSCG